MSISGPDDAKTPTKVRQPSAKHRLDNGQGWLSTCLLQAQQQPVLTLRDPTLYWDIYTTLRRIRKNIPTKPS